jgi:hypothetical protein
MEREIVFRLPVSQVNLLLSLLGNAPNASHSYPLMMAIKGQGDAQVTTEALQQEPNDPGPVTKTA